MELVHARSLAVLRKLVETMGVSFEQLAHKVDVDLGLIDVVDATIPADKYLRLHEEIIKQTGNPDFGLLVGRLSYIESFHFYMYLASTSKSLKEWINLVPNTPITLGDLVRTKVKQKADLFILTLDFKVPPNPVRCLVTDHLLALTAMLMDGFSVLPVRPNRVDFTYQAPNNVKALKDVFRAPLYFKQPVSALYYKKNILDLLQVDVATQVYDRVGKEIDGVLPDLSWQSDPFSVELYTVIRHQLPSGDYSINRVAENLNISRRTLQRRLQERETNYQKFVQQVKCRLAITYLQDRKLNITDIALMLGYSDPQSFSAAFKSWRGKTPSEFRRGDTL